jgi:hypothetical protein
MIFSAKSAIRAAKSETTIPIIRRIFALSKTTLKHHDYADHKTQQRRRNASDGLRSVSG